MLGVAQWCSLLLARAMDVDLAFLICNFFLAGGEFVDGISVDKS
jgi:hypothetical protein